SREDDLGEPSFCVRPHALDPIPSLMMPLSLRHASPVAVLLLANACGSWVCAQSTEFRLDQSGNWVQTAAPEPGTDAAILADARKALAEERWADALRISTDWLKGNERSDSPLLPDGHTIKADAMTALGDEYEALYDYE